MSFIPIMEPFSAEDHVSEAAHRMAVAIQKQTGAQEMFKPWPELADEARMQWGCIATAVVIVTLLKIGNGIMPPEVLQMMIDEVIGGGPSDGGTQH